MKPISLKLLPVDQQKIKNDNSMLTGKSCQFFGRSGEIGHFERPHMNFDPGPAFRRMEADHSSLVRSKRPSDRKPEAASLARKKNSRKLFSNAELAVRVVIIDQTERDVDDRHLNTKLKSDA